MITNMVVNMNSAKKKENQIDEYRETIIPILVRNDVDKAGIFGSFARNEAREDSDIDILVSFRSRKSLFDLSRLEMELENESHRKVEVVTYDSISPLIRDRILKEEVKIL
ncbi:nucleotidyltransferase family protein [Methanolobus sp. WCC4]|uniref:nucleotidyltransferase family protein n=1 Tax=Methanolobus sp. WCC4 TaxID=3125784 RepID=UPI0030FBF925